MKDFIKFFSIITGLFRSIVSILFLFAIGFIIFVDRNLLLAFFDLIGFDNVSSNLLKPICLVISVISFVINTAIARNIFKASENGKAHLSNMFFGLIFMAIDAFILITYRERLIFILIGLNGILVLNSIIGLIGRFKGIYNNEAEVVKKTEYIEVNSNNENEISAKNDSQPIKIDFAKKESASTENSDDIKLLKKEKTEVDGKITSTKTLLIDQDSQQLDQENKKEELGEKTDQRVQAIVDKEDEVEKKSVNKVLLNNDKDTTYSPDLAEDFKKKEDEKVYDKSNFVREEQGQEKE